MSRSRQLTAVIPTRNRLPLLTRAVGSALAQSGVDVSVVIVDDGSDSDTARVLQSLAGLRVRLVRHDRSRGVSRARNAGLHVVETPWVAFLDDDDLWAPTKSISQLIAMEEDPDAQWSCTGAVHIDARMRPVYWQEPPASDEAMSMLCRVGGIPGGGSGVLVRTELARAVGGFDPDLSIFADWDFYYRLGLRSRPVAVNSPLVGYYVHRDSMYHDPVELARELLFLDLKHAASTPPLEPDYTIWALRLLAVAVTLRDYRALARLGGSRIVRRVEPARLGAFLWNRLVLGRRRGRECPPHWQGESLRWLRAPFEPRAPGAGTALEAAPPPGPGGRGRAFSTCATGMRGLDRHLGGPQSPHRRGPPPLLSS